MHANLDRLPADAEWIVVNGGGRRDMVRNALRDLPVSIVHLPMRRFAKGATQNVGAGLARSPLLLLLDADIVLEPDAWREMASLIDDRTVVTLGRITDPHVRDERSTAPPVSVTQVVVDGQTVRIETSVVDVAASERNAPGNVLLRRRRFDEVDGFYGSLVDANFLDIDLLIRLELAGCRRAEAGRGIHVDPHPPVPDDQRRARDARNAAYCLERLQRGERQGTAARDRRSWLPLAVIEGDPTRI